MRSLLTHVATCSVDVVLFPVCLFLTPSGAARELVLVAIGISLTLLLPIFVAVRNLGKVRAVAREEAEDLRVWVADQCGEGCCCCC